jgi:decaprenyl-phosphate phosphoribosyltransferase
MAVRPYVQIARTDHWFKNVFMFPGTVLAFLFIRPGFDAGAAIRLVVGFLAVCLIASANYVINEILDAPYDKNHPVKKNRPVPSGQVKIPLAYLEFALLILAGSSLSLCVNLPFLVSNLSLLFMGLVYNVPPVRTKDVPYLDVLSESVNNPIRLLLGWYSATPLLFPPLSIIVAYWMLGAFFMAAKRVGEHRELKDHETIRVYRKSLSRYTQDKLIISMFFYASFFSFMSAIFLIRYKFELILLAPFFSALIGEYIRLAYLPGSPAQYPEKLYRQKRLMALCVMISVLFVVLLVVRIPWLDRVFDPMYKSLGP